MPRKTDGNSARFTKNYAAGILDLWKNAYLKLKTVFIPSTRIFAYAVRPHSAGRELVIKMNIDPFDVFAIRRAIYRQWAMGDKGTILHNVFEEVPASLVISL